MRPLWTAARLGYGMVQGRILGLTAALGISLFAGISNASTVTWLTSPDQAVVLQPFLESDDALPALTLASSRGGTPVDPSTIQVQTEKTFQNMIGYGAALTEASAINLLKLTPDQQTTALKALFDRKNGAGLTFLRVPMGACDLSDGGNGEYTYDDSPGAGADPDLKYFSMARDEKTLRLLQQIKKINPALKIMINPWTAPPWMKDNRQFEQGSFETKNMEALASYFIRTIEEYHRHGLEVDYAGIQNEPGISIQYPSMLMTDDQQAQFIRGLGKRLLAKGFKTKILANDDNYVAVDRVLGFLKDPQTAPYIGAVAFHCWSNDPEKADQIPATSSIFETECGGNINSTNYTGDFNWWNRNRVIETAKRNVRVVLAWNLVSDQLAEPVAGAQSCKTCRGLLVVKPDQKGFRFEATPELAGLMHGSRFVQMNAQRLGTDGGPDGLVHTAFRNPDGSYVILVNNWQGKRVNFKVRLKDRIVASRTLAPNDAATIVVSDDK